MRVHLNHYKKVPLTEVLHVLAQVVLKMGTVWKVPTVTLFIILSYVVCSENNHPPWHRRLKNVTASKAPLLGMDNKDRILNDFFVLIDKKKVRQASKDDCVQNFLEHLKTKITKNTDYYDIKRVYAFGDLLILRVKLPERLVSVLQEHTSAKIVESNTR